VLNGRVGEDPLCPSDGVGYLAGDSPPRQSSSGEPRHIESDIGRALVERFPEPGEAFSGWLTTRSERSERLGIRLTEMGENPRKSLAAQLPGSGEVRGRSAREDRADVFPDHIAHLTQSLEDVFPGRDDVAEKSLDAAA
jgi:hypothetical protein